MALSTPRIWFSPPPTTLVNADWMLDSPATSMAQQGEMIWALAGHGAVNKSTTARMEARSLWPENHVPVAFK